MGKASEEALAELHGAVAKALTGVITEGVVVSTNDNGEPVKTSASAAYFAAAITFLKNNSITSDPSTNSDLDALTKALAAKRKDSKGKLTARDIQAASEQLERDLPGFMQ